MLMEKALDNTIEKLKLVVEKMKVVGDGECWTVEEHEQIVKWLEELKELSTSAEKLKKGDAEQCNKYEKDNRWIPCSERLPEESLNSVIGWDEYRKRCVFIQHVQGKFQNMGTDDSFDITAWRPLPEPYKEEEEKSDRTGSNK